LKTFFSAASNH